MQFIEKTRDEKNNCNRESLKKEMMEEFYGVNWLFMRLMPRNCGSKGNQWHE